MWLQNSRFALLLLLAMATGPISGAAYPSVGDQAPDFSAILVDGNTMKLADLRGSVILINFWASWCAPCREEMPLLDTFYQKFKDKGLVVLAVSTDGSVTTQQLRKVATVLSFPLAKRVDGPYREIEKKLPTTYVIDRSGAIRYAQPGSFKLDRLNDLLIPLIREPMPDKERPTETAEGGTAP